MADFRVVAERVARELLQFGERLDARVAGADEDEGQLAFAMARRGRGGGRFEPLQDVVAELDRVLERLEAERVLA